MPCRPYVFLTVAIVGSFPSIPACRPGQWRGFPPVHVSTSVADRCRCLRPLLSLRFPGWFRTVLLSVDVAGSFGSLMVGLRSRSQVCALQVDFCRCEGLFLPSTSQRNVWEDGNPRGRAAIGGRDTATPYEALSETGVRTPPRLPRRIESRRSRAIELR